MATNFVARDYVEALQQLMDNQGVNVCVEGFRASRDYEKFTTPVAELLIDGVETTQPGMFRALDGVLSAGLLVMVRLNEDESEEKAFELALDVATALLDEADAESAEPQPVMPYGPINVVGIDPEAPEGALQHRVASWLVRYEQQMRFTRANQIVEPDPPTTLHVGRAPEIGPGHEDDYRQLVPWPEE